MNNPLRNRQAEVEREYRRIERQEFIKMWTAPAVLLVALPFGLYATLHYPWMQAVFAGITAIGVPLCMWLERRRR